MRILTIAVLCIAMLTVATHADADQHYASGPWLWTITPAPTSAHLHADFLSLASDGAITEKDVAVNAPRLGDSVGHFQWQNGTLPDKSHNIAELVRETYGELLNPYMFYGLIRVYFQPDAYDKNPEARTIFMHFQGGPSKAWINGGCPGYFPSLDGGTFHTDLKPGDNLLLIKARGHTARPYIYPWQEVEDSIVILSVANREDVNGDGEVNLQDLLTVAAALGKDNPVADIDDNGIVEIADVLAVANAIDVPPAEDPPPAAPRLQRQKRQKLKPWAAFKRR